jgi:hypothetical protein
VSPIRLNEASGIGRAAPGALSNIVQPEQNTKLYRSYCQHGATTIVTRHRGKSPRQAAFFFRSPEIKFHAANLARLFVLYGLPLPRGGGARLNVCKAVLRERRSETTPPDAESTILTGNDRLRSWCN